MAQKVIGHKAYATIQLICKKCKKNSHITGYISFDLNGKARAPFDENFMCDDCRNTN